MTLYEAAKSVGMPDATPGDVRTSEGKSQFTNEVISRSMSDTEADAMIAARSAERGDHGRHKLSMGKRVAIGLAATGALLTPQVNEAVNKVQDTVVDVAKDFNANLDNDRLFNPQQGNPSNAAEIVQSWDQDPTKTAVTIEAPAEGGPEPGSAEAGQDMSEAGLPQVTPEASTFEREAGS